MPKPCWAKRSPEADDRKNGHQLEGLAQCLPGRRSIGAVFYLHGDDDDRDVDDDENEKDTDDGDDDALSLPPSLLTLTDELSSTRQACNQTGNSSF